MTLHVFGMCLPLLVKDAVLKLRRDLRGCGCHGDVFLTALSYSAIVRFDFTELTTFVLHNFKLKGGGMGLIRDPTT